MAEGVSRDAVTTMRASHPRPRAPRQERRSCPFRSKRYGGIILETGPQPSIHHASTRRGPQPTRTSARSGYRYACTLQVWVWAPFAAPCAGTITEGGTSFEPSKWEHGCGQVASSAKRTFDNRPPGPRSLQQPTRPCAESSYSAISGDAGIRAITSTSGSTTGCPG